MMLVSLQEGVLHLGGDESTVVDPEKECYPAGQGVGAIDSLVPAGDIVRGVVAEAERTLDRLLSLR
jgi:enoyl-[acyl-carrier protein] reductase II